MTAATLSRLPFAAGGALAGSLARVGYWALTRAMDFGSMILAQFMRAPVAISTTFAIAGFSLLAGSNALFFQTARHPAPLFFPVVHRAAPAPVIRPVIPAVRPRFQPTVDTETTGSVRTDTTVDTIGSADVMNLQRKLAALKFLNDPADGIFGRHTASALRAFEVRAGMKPRGELTRQVLAAVLAAPLPDAVEPLPPGPTLATMSTAARPAPAALALAPAATRGGPVPLAPLPPAAAVTAPAAAAPATGTLGASSMPPAVATTTAGVAAPQAVAPQSAAPETIAAAGDAAASNDTSAVIMNSLPQTAGTAAAPAAATQPAPVAPVAVATAQAAPTGGAVLTAAQKLAAQMGTLPPEATAGTAVPAAVTSSDPGDNAGSTDPALITKIQRGLASLGFLGQKIDGVPGEGTAKAIRNFEVFYDYRVTGLATPQLLDLLIQHGAET